MLPTDIQQQYHNSRKLATELARQRKAEVYGRAPRLEEIDGLLLEKAYALGLELLKLPKEQREEAKQRQLAQIEALKAEYQSILHNLGIEQSSLVPQFTCPRCEDTGYVKDGTLCPCARLKLAGRQYLSSGIGSKACFAAFDESLFKDEAQLQRTKKAAALCKSYGESLALKGVKGLLLLGDPGLGKTFLADCIGREAIEHGFTVKKYTAYNLIDAALRAMRNREAGPELTEVDLLIIDDLGTEPMVPGVTIETLYSAINERQFAGKAMVIATNLAKSQIYEQYGERTASRIFAAREFLSITLKGSDLRRT